VQNLTPVIEDTNRLDQAVRNQIICTVEKLKQAPILNEAVMRKALKIAGGCYDLETGVVDVIIE
jgi:carbonic anhydrase